MVHDTISSSDRSVTLDGGSCFRGHLVVHYVEELWIEILDEAYNS